MGDWRTDTGTDKEERQCLTLEFEGKAARDAKEASLKTSAARTDRGPHPG